jgi:hypothetical protein
VIEEEGSRKKRLRITQRLRKKDKFLLNFIENPFVPPHPLTTANSVLLPKRGEEETEGIIYDDFKFPGGICQPNQRDL